MGFAESEEYAPVIDPGLIEYLPDFTPHDSWPRSTMELTWVCPVMSTSTSSCGAGVLVGRGSRSNLERIMGDGCLRVRYGAHAARKDTRR